MYRILLAVDSDEQRAKQAVDAITALPHNGGNLEVVVLNVFEELNTPIDEGSEPTELSEALFDETKFPTSVEVAIERLEAAGVDAEPRREHGDPPETIVAVAEEIDADCIALCGRKRSTVGRLFFGSVTRTVLFSTDRPVHVVMA